MARALTFFSIGKRKKINLFSIENYYLADSRTTLKPRSIVLQQQQRDQKIISSNFQLEKRWVIFFGTIIIT